MNGIINGIDVEEWNPKTDSFIAERRRYLYYY